MDSTWKTISGYVTSILMASICNVGIPLAFAFGPSESKELYDMFYSSFDKTINVLFLFVLALVIYLLNLYKLFHFFSE